VKAVSRDSRQTLPLLHALPVLSGGALVLVLVLPRAQHHTVLALGGRHSEVLPGVGLCGDGVGLRTRRGVLLLGVSVSS